MSSYDYRRRFVWFFAMTYSTPDEFEPLLKYCSHYAYIYHDKDATEPHYHILMHYDNARSGYAVIKDFKSVSFSNTFLEDARNVRSCYEYLTHTNNPDKFQYDKALIVSHNPVYWEEFLPGVRERPETEVADFLEDLLSNDFDLVWMAKKYGRDFIKNYRSYVDFRNEVLPLTKRFNYK